MECLDTLLTSRSLPGYSIRPVEMSVSASRNWRPRVYDCELSLQSRLDTEASYPPHEDKT